MAAGRKRIPREVKVIRGTLRPDRDMGPGPDFERLDTLPDPPNHLAEAACNVWRDLGQQLVGAGVLAVSDTTAFATMCIHGGIVVEASRAIKEDGVLIDGSRGKVKHPACQLLRDNSTAFRQYCALFGVDPADRTKIPTMPKQDAVTDFLGY